MAGASGDSLNTTQRTVEDAKTPSQKGGSSDLFG
jgi:hypothetical protein